MPIIDARYYRTLVVCPNKTIAAEVQPLIQNGLPLAPVHVIQEYPTRRALVDLLRQMDPKLCFVDFATDRDLAFGFLTELHATVQELPVVVLLPNNDPELILKCLRQGATEFLIRPFTSDQMDQAVEKIARLFPPANTRGGSGGCKIIGVFPAKGACGATTLACSLAYQSKRLGAKKILLADLDPLTGTISFLLKLKSTYSFLDVLARQQILDHDLWKQMIVTSQGVDILLSPENLMDGIDDLPDATGILDFALQHYEVVIADCSNAFTRWNLSVARNCDELLLVTTNELGALQASQKVLANFEHNNLDPKRVKLIVNRYDNNIGLNSDIISEALQCDVFQLIPSDYETVQRSLMEGKPIAANSTMGKALAALADKVCEHIQPSAEDAKKAASKSGILSSLFSR
jgi:pilus assembly protein CpaE